MKKRIISLIIIGLLCVSSVMPVGAASDTEVAQAASEFAFRQQCMSLVNTLDNTVELERAEAGISDVQSYKKYWITALRLRQMKMEM